MAAGSNEWRLLVKTRVAQQRPTLFAACTRPWPISWFGAEAHGHPAALGAGGAAHAAGGAELHLHLVRAANVAIHHGVHMRIVSVTS